MRWISFPKVLFLRKEKEEVVEQIEISSQPKNEEDIEIIPVQEEEEEEEETEIQSILRYTQGNSGLRLDRAHSPVPCT